MEEIDLERLHYVVTKLEERAWWYEVAFEALAGLLEEQGLLTADQIRLRILQLTEGGKNEEEDSEEQGDVPEMRTDSGVS